MHGKQRHQRKFLMENANHTFCFGQQVDWGAPAPLHALHRSFRMHPATHPSETMRLGPMHVPLYVTNETGINN
jgi:hypothetical protein